MDKYKIGKLYKINKRDCNINSNRIDKNVTILLRGDLKKCLPCNFKVCDIKIDKYVDLRQSFEVMKE